MSNADRASPSDAREEPVPIEVHRCELGKKVLWAGLSEQITGCMTHWLKGRSRYCGGAECRYQCSRLESLWKGYVAALVYRHESKTWIYGVVELPGHAELDTRGRYARGQIWELSRAVDRRGKQSPVAARFVRDELPQTTPPAFAVEQVLVHLFQEQRLDLRTRNPMPPRLAYAPIPAVLPEKKEDHP